MVRYLGMVRVSTKKQAGEDRRSLPYQIREITAEVDRAGGELVDIVEFKESGHKTKWKGELEKVRETARRLRVNYVITSELDRLARKQHWQGQFVEDLDKAGIRYRSVLDDLDTGRDNDRIKLLALGMVNEIFIINLRRKVRAGAVMRLEQGLPYPRAPYGYRRVGQTWEIDPERAPFVLKAYQWRREGVGVPTITKHLVGHGAPPPTAGGVWYETAVREMLHRPAYKGVIDWGRGRRSRQRQGQPVYVEDAFPVIVPPDLWQEVQQINAARHRTRARSESPYLLAGLLVGPCGCAMHGQRAGETRADGLRARVYRTQCFKWKNGEHRMQTVSANWLERQVVDHLDSLLLHREVDLSAIRAPAGPAFDVQGALQEVHQQLGRLEDALLSGRIVGERYDLRLERLRVEEARLRAMSERPPAEPDQGAIMTGTARYMAEWQTVRSGGPRLKTFLQRFLAKIEIGPPRFSGKPDRDIKLVLRGGG